MYEVKIDDEYLMSSLFTVAEMKLARLGLAALTADHLDVVVGGLGLGYTACAVLEDSRVASMIVVDALAEVIDWHERELLPSAATMIRDPRTRLVCGDFFAMAADVTADPAGPIGRVVGGVRPDGAGPAVRRRAAGRRPQPSTGVCIADNAALYTVDGMRRLAGTRCGTGGVFALWSNDPPDRRFHGRARAGVRHRDRARGPVREPAAEPRVVKHRLRRQDADDLAVHRWGTEVRARTGA